MRFKKLCKCGIVGFSVAIALALVACSDSSTKVAVSGQTGVEEAVSIATEAYIYGYPLVTMDMTRKVFTNVAAPDQAHAPILLTFKIFSVCKDFFMASMRPRLLVELSQV